MTNNQAYQMLADIELLCRKVQRIPYFWDRVEARIKTLTSAVAEMEKSKAEGNCVDVVALHSTEGQVHGLRIALEIFEQEVQL